MPLDVKWGNAAGRLFVISGEILSYRVACRYNHLIVCLTLVDLSVTANDQ